MEPAPDFPLPVDGKQAYCVLGELLINWEQALDKTGHWRFLFDHRSPQIFTENVESDQEKSMKSVKSVVEMAYFSAESILVRLQDKTVF